MKVPSWRRDGGFFIFFLPACLAWLLFGLWPAAAGFALAHYSDAQAGYGICIAGLGCVVMLVGAGVLRRLYRRGITEQWHRAPQLR